MQLNARKNSDIEALRTVGVLFVLIGHSTQMFTAFPALEAFLGLFNGSFAVDLFFAMSGYMITRGLLPNLQDAYHDKRHWRVAKAFWVRRMFRLWPLAWFWLIAMLILSLVWNKSGAFYSFETNVAATVAGVLQFANIRAALAWAEGFGYGASFVYWSLSLEEQFYFALPLILIFFRKKYIWIFAFIFCFQVWQVRDIWLCAFRTDAMALGCLLAVAHVRKAIFLESIKRFLIILPRFFLWIGFLLLMILMAYLSTWSKFKYFVGVIAILVNILVLVASFELNLLIPNAAIEKLFVWVGDRTYAIYLVHIPVYYIVREFWHRFGSGEYTVVLIIAHYIAAAFLVAVLADISFRFVEKPFRRLGNKLSARVLSGGSAPVSRANTVRTKVGAG